MKYVTALLVAMALSGCDQSPSTNGAPSEDRPAYTLRTHDSQYGVVCYRWGGSGNNLSCVKVN